MNQKVTSFTTPACNLLFNTVSNIWKSLITLTSTLTLAQGGLNPNAVPTFDVRQWYHLPCRLSLACPESMQRVARQPQRRVCVAFSKMPVITARQGVLSPERPCAGYPWCYPVLPSVGFSFCCLIFWPNA